MMHTTFPVGTRISTPDGRAEAERQRYGAVKVGP